MKKSIIIAAVIIAALAFGTTSCNKENAKCWKVTLSANHEGESESITIYWWLTETDCDTSIAENKGKVESAGGTDFKAEKEETSKYTTQTDCEAQNNYENCQAGTIFGWMHP